MFCASCGYPAVAAPRPPEPSFFDPLPDEPEPAAWLPCPECGCTHPPVKVSRRVSRWETRGVFATFAAAPVAIFTLPMWLEGLAKGSVDGLAMMGLMLIGTPAMLVWMLLVWLIGGAAMRSTTRAASRRNPMRRVGFIVVGQGVLLGLLIAAALGLGLSLFRFRGSC